MPSFSVQGAGRRVVDTAPLEELVRGALESTTAARVEESHVYFAACAARLSGVRATPDGIAVRHQGVQCGLPCATCECNDVLEDDEVAEAYCD